MNGQCAQLRDQTVSEYTRRSPPDLEPLDHELVGVVLRADLRGRESSSGMDVVLRGRAPSSMMAISPDGAKSRPVCMDPRGVLHWW
jgi:hypothetical protein